MAVPAVRVGGLIMVGDLSDAERTSDAKAAVYVRVLSADEKTDLDWQVARVAAWARSNGCLIDLVVAEVGSAFDGKRRKFLVLFADPAVGIVIVEPRDRFVRFGAGCVAAVLDADCRRMVIVDDAEVDDDLVRDMTELMTLLCVCLYGRRSAAHRAARAVEAAAVGGDRDGCPGGGRRHSSDARREEVIAGEDLRDLRGVDRLWIHLRGRLARWSRGCGEGLV